MSVTAKNEGRWTQSIIYDLRITLTHDFNTLVTVIVALIHEKKSHQWQSLTNEMPYLVHHTKILFTSKQKNIHKNNELNPRSFLNDTKKF